MADSLEDMVKDTLPAEQSDDSNETGVESVSKQSPNKTLPNGCIKHSLDDNGLVKLSGNFTSNSSDVSAASERTVNSDTDSNGASTCDTTDVSPVHRSSSQNHSECDVDSADIDDELTASSDGATDSVSTAFSRVSISDTESSSRRDSESKLQRPLTYVVYESEEQMPDIMRLITKDLSEPYSIYTYRYFIHNWPKLCFLVRGLQRMAHACFESLGTHDKSD